MAQGREHPEKTSSFVMLNYIHFVKLEFHKTIIVWHFTHQPTSEEIKTEAGVQKSTIQKVEVNE